MDRAQSIVALLEVVLEGAVRPEDALRRWPAMDGETDDLVAQAWHDLSHYASDEDIRQRDPDYWKYQRALLKEDADAIRRKYSLM